MMLPFTRSEFLDVFASYNEAIWPIQLALIAMALAAVGMSLRGRSRQGVWIVILLAVLWDWMGVVYHWRYFAAINPVAYGFGAAFVVQSALLLWFGVVRRRLVFRPRFDVLGILGGLLILYALIGYPVAGSMVGHAYPLAPTFGVPCPTAIFTLGMLLWVEGRVSPWLLAVPIAWSTVATAAAVSLGMVEDFGLTAAGILALLGASWKNGRLTEAARSAGAASAGAAADRAAPLQP
jgi:hypothetical protein